MVFVRCVVGTDCNMKQSWMRLAWELEELEEENRDKERFIEIVY